MVFTRAQSRLSNRNRINASRPHFDTPKKARIRAACYELERHGHWSGCHNKREIFHEYGVSTASGYRILKDDSDRTHHNNPIRKETRGRPRILSQGDIEKLEHILHLKR